VQHQYLWIDNLQLYPEQVLQIENVVHGIKESPAGTKRPDCQKVDFDNIIYTFSLANIPPIQSSSIRDLPIMKDQ